MANQKNNPQHGQWFECSVELADRTCFQVYEVILLDGAYTSDGGTLCITAGTLGIKPMSGPFRHHYPTETKPIKLTLQGT
jgi:hypothetical protein